MARSDLNYFTCTLGQAAHLRKQDEGSQRSFETVLMLIEENTKSFPGVPALGFADYTSKRSSDWPPDQVTFSQLRNLSKFAAIKLADTLDLPVDNDKPPTIGLLCHSSLEFVLTWLGLMRLGCRAFHLAPHLDHGSMEHLCKMSNMKTILVDKAQEKRAAQFQGEINIVKIPSFQGGTRPNWDYCGESIFNNEDVNIAFIQHSSGTSSGLPKPILQSQWGAVGCLPSFSHEDQPATFTTTPLYHGGLADCLRAWASGAMIWFFPEGVVPITGSNVVRSVTYAREKSRVPIKYFSSVPYVLQLLAEEHEGIRILQSMDLVGVGGAALAPSVGDRLVELGVKLLSRMGSAECGFLMSSHRDYDKDKQWQYLRPVKGSTFLSFEPRDDSLAELVVKPNWPLISKTNRDDGSYATADLFEPHPSIPNAWRYHSRADAQITLANGKKFDPSPLEEAIKASTQLISEVLVFGGGRDYAGALLFKASNDFSNEEVIDSVWPEVQKLNKETQSHSRLTRSMLVVIEPREGEETLAKSSKGTIIRRQAEARYADVINSSYSDRGTDSTVTHEVSDADLSAVLLNLFAQVLGREIDLHEDLFHQGVDSIACIQVRKLIESRILPSETPKLPTNIIYDSGNVDVLAENLARIRKGGDHHTSNRDADEWKLMKELAEKYSCFNTYDANSIKKHGEVVVLTGASGALGAHILSELCSDARVRRVYCLLRGQSNSSCRERVIKALSKRGLPRLEELDKSEGIESKVVCLPCQLSESHLGLSDEEWTRMVTEATVFIHAAWAVNFSLRLSSFENHILGTRNMINAAISSSARFLFISSTAAVSSDPSPVIAEKVSWDPSHASPLGYSRSKWVAEQVCARAHEQSSRNMRSHTRSADISIIRVGQLCGNEAGAWNASEAYPLMLSTASFVGCLPDLPNEVLNWLPVDQAAKIILEIALRDHSSGQSTASELPVYHVLNIHTTPSWNQMLRWVSQVPGGPSFNAVRPEEWLQRLESALSGPEAGHPSQALLGLWRSRYAHVTGVSKENNEREGNGAQESPRFDITSSSWLSPTMRNVRPLSQDRVMKMWNWIQQNVGRGFEEPLSGLK
ncbi:acetyl-CoA synthetase-like protein [Hypoxylon sp. FL0890]|nr:acetyl-CoA synthetase-like protein [Hypoxylon sp. FL0890]